MMELNQKMIDLFNEVADATIKKVREEKETNLSDDTYRMISLTQSLFNNVNCYVDYKSNGVNPFCLG